MISSVTEQPARNHVGGPPAGSQRTAGGGLRQTEVFAATMLVAIPALFFLLDRHAGRGAPLADDAAMLLMVYAGALLLTVVLRGVVALRQLIGVGLGGSMVWMIFYWGLSALLSEPHRPMTSWQYAAMARQYMHLGLSAMLLHWHLLPVYLLDELERGGPDAVPPRWAANDGRAIVLYGSCRRLGAILGGLVLLVDGIALGWLVFFGLPSLTDRLVWMAIGGPFAVNLCVATVLVVRLHRLRDLLVTANAPAEASSDPTGSASPGEVAPDRGGTPPERSEATGGNEPSSPNDAS